MPNLTNNLFSHSSLPFERMAKDEISIIELSLKEGWEKLLIHHSNYSLDLINDDEDRVTYAFMRLLNLLRDKEPKGIFSKLKGTFESLTASSHFMDYQGNKIKQPDLVFRPTHNPMPGIDHDYYAFFIEAKVISNKGHQKPREYHINGVARFIDGRYAWAMQEGMMLAYVRSGLTLPQGVSRYLSRSDNENKYSIVEMPKRCEPPNPIPHIYSTIHERKWNYIKQAGFPGNIEIRHLWLDCIK